MKVAKLFSNGGRQAVRLPAEFRFSGDEVFIRRDPVSGDVVLSEKPERRSWEEFFALRDSIHIPSEFLDQRPGNEPLALRDPFKTEDTQ